MNIKTICMGVALLLVSLPAANADVIFNNWNQDGNLSCAEASTCAGSPSFILSAATLITDVDTAYATFGDTVDPETISIFDSSSLLVGSALSTDSGGFFPGNFQTAAFNLILSAGTYTVGVSDSTYWAYNQTSLGQGFTEVDGSAATPEPGTWGMMAVGFLGLVAAARRRCNQ